MKDESIAMVVSFPTSAPVVAGDRANLVQRIAANAAERRQLMIEALGGDASDTLKFIEKGMPQSLLFMVEIIPLTTSFVCTSRKM
ncbi:MAG: hypothetical protein SGJ17_01145 [Hyphomicrobiales bacterium]|nr:hypothetical protein [Hyphomicrobiales bacterium]